MAHVLSIENVASSSGQIRWPDALTGKTLFGGRDVDGTGFDAVMRSSW
jgi:hypothetical protein